MDKATALLVLVLALGVFGRNQLIMVAALVGVLLRVLPSTPLTGWIEAYGIPTGLTLLTLAVLAPIASGRTVVQDIVRELTSVEGLVSVLGGILAAWVSARGVELLEINPRVILGLMIGTIIGAAFLRGIPVGPLFAAGLAAVFLFIAKAIGL